MSHPHLARRSSLIWPGLGKNRYYWWIPFSSSCMRKSERCFQHSKERSLTRSPLCAPLQWDGWRHQPVNQRVLILVSPGCWAKFPPWEPFLWSSTTCQAVLVWTTGRARPEMPPMHLETFSSFFMERKGGKPCFMHGTASEFLGKSRAL
jgi:hypothetical protein